MVKNQHLDFIKSLTDKNADENVIKIANLIHGNLERVIPLGTFLGRRLQLLVEIAKREFENTSVEYTGKVGTETTTINGISKLESMTVGPFRGFYSTETFDLDERLVLIYGPNGTGKSSFCEALEYGLLESVREASNGRYKNEVEYLKNSHNEQFKKPVIKGIVEGLENAIVVNPSEDEFRFCFIEKNRIDNFSRIATLAPARQTELISALFGLDDFNEFVKGFSPDMEKYIDLDGKREAEFEGKRKSLETNEEFIKSNVIELKKVEDEERKLADSYNKGMSYEKFVAEIGTDETPGLIKQLTSKLQKSIPHIVGLRKIDLTSIRARLDVTISKIKEKEIEMSNCKDEISYKGLYESISALTEVSKDNCPACKTPIVNTNENPFVLAEENLIKLKHISVLEEEMEKMHNSLLNGFSEVYQFILRASKSEAVKEHTSELRNCLVLDDDISLLNAEWWRNLTKVHEKSESKWLLLETAVGILEENDSKVTEGERTRKKDSEKLKKLQKLHEEVIRIQSKREVLDERIEKSERYIREFNESNKELIEAISLERIEIIQNKNIAQSYSAYVQLLRKYKNDLPRKYVENLGESAVMLYNSFNRNDPENELLAELKLPVLSDERIKISFKNNPNKYFDALQILSEGHIRCIGLAILLAKNLDENSPFIIFDDPVNAIDDEHRESIRKTLFEDDHFEGKQIILTCHGEEFSKDIENLLGSERSKYIKRYTFLPKSGDQHLRVMDDSNPRNYVLAAQRKIDEFKKRDALSKSRQALEYLMKNKLWAYVSKHGDGNLSIRLRSHNSPIELRQLTEQLKAKITKSNFNHDDKDRILEVLNKLLGGSGNSREWRYLNKGTHEESDRTEFDFDTVKEIVDSLVALDSVLSGKIPVRS